MVHFKMSGCTSDDSDSSSVCRLSDGNEHVWIFIYLFFGIIPIISWNKL